MEPIVKFVWEHISVLLIGVISPIVIQWAKKADGISWINQNSTGLIRVLAGLTSLIAAWLSSQAEGKTFDYAQVTDWIGAAVAFAGTYLLQWLTYRKAIKPLDPAKPITSDKK